MQKSTETAPARRPPGRETVHALGAFRLESGQLLPDLRLACVTYGALSPARDNVLLVLPGTSNTRHSAIEYIGPGRAFDTDRFHVVCVDGIGAGASSQPADGLGAAFPGYGVRDLVRASAELVRRGLELGQAPLAAVAGASMGAFQALEWAIHEPVAVRSAILLVPAARAGGVIRTVTRQMVDLLALDPRWRGGDYSAPPVDGLRLAGRHYFAWAVSDQYLESRDPQLLEDEIEASGQRFVQFDAWNLIRRYQASAAHDVAAAFGGSLPEALRRVSARLLVLPCRQDRLLGVQAARQIAQGVRDARYVEIDSARGHLAWRPVQGTRETALITEHVRSFLSC